MLLPITKPPENWTEDDLKKLCIDRIAEHQRLDYKRELKLEPPRERRELLKDVTALANAQGGVIIYGIDEVMHNDLGNVAGTLTPMTDTNLIDKATRIIRSNISPSIEFYTYKINALEGGFYLILFVPESRLKPHALNMDKKIDYYIRRNQDNFPMSEVEIRQLYTTTVRNMENIDQRYKNLERQKFNEEIISSFIMTCMPLTANLNIANTLSVNRDQLNTAHYNSWFNGNILRPFVDRFEAYNVGGNFSFGLTLHQNGEFAYSTGIHRFPQDSFQLQWFVTNWLRALKYYSEAYSALGYWGQIRLWLEVNIYTDDDFKLSTTGYYDYNFDRKHLLIWIDRMVDDFANPKEVCIPLIRYLMQACRVDWSDEEARRWFNSYNMQY